MLRLITAVTFLFITTIIVAQTGRISGTIVDGKTGETLPGATALIEGTQKGAQADFDGKFAINNVAPGKVTLIISYISYSPKKITDVVVRENEVTDVNIQLNASASQDLGEVEVVVTLNKENNTALVLQQKNNASVSDGISAETIKRSPDRNTSDVLKRISGVTIQDDKFVIIRGLNERYNASFLNGAPLPSTEPDKKAFAFDLFPANMLDNIVVNKTATPDMPSEFAGGIVQVNTKSIPEKNFVSVSAGTGYNTITTGKDKIVYKGGKWDKFGFDDGSRDLPSEVPQYKELSSWISTKDQGRMATYFNNDWGYSNARFSPNNAFQVGAGYNFKLKERDFIGVIFSLGYSATQNLYTLKRKEYYNLSPINILPPEEVQLEQAFNQKVYQTQTSTGALLNLSCKIDKFNSIHFKNLVNGNADNRFINSTGSANLIDANPSLNTNNSRFFSANQIVSSQLSGEHFIEKPKIKIYWNVSQSNIKRVVPNLRFTAYTRFKSVLDPSDPNPKDTILSANVAYGGSSTTGPDYSGYRVYSKLKERMNSARLDVSRVFKLNEKIKIEGKVGGFYQYRTRTFGIRQFGLSQFIQPGKFFADSLRYLTEDQIFATQNMSVTPDGYGGFKLIEITMQTDNYSAQSSLRAGYGMVEFKYTEKIRLITGARYESFNQVLTTNYNKPKAFDSVFVNSVVNDVLPSVNFIYNITEKIGARLAYYKTLNRPEFRELAVTNWYDPETRLSIAGTYSLSRCYIQNFDARFEFYPGKGQLITTSGFYKYFNKPIERYISGGDKNQITYQNANFGTVYGAELEYRLNVGSLFKLDSSKFFNHLNLFSNLSLIKSLVNVRGINSALPDTRVMQGQAPYIINAGISYIDNDNNFSVTAMVNRVGPRIYLVGSDQVPNRWENARTVLDLQVTKSFFKNRLDIRFNVKDILHQDWIVYYKNSNRKDNSYNPQTDLVNFQRNFGTVYSFAIGFRF